MMTDSTARKAALELLEDVFISILAFADQHGITVKDMAELLQVAQVRAMRRQGKSQQEIMAASGFVLKTIPPGRHYSSNIVRLRLSVSIRLMR